MQQTTTHRTPLSQLIIQNVTNICVLYACCNTKILSIYARRVCTNHSSKLLILISLIQINIEIDKLLVINRRVFLGFKFTQKQKPNI